MTISPSFSRPLVVIGPPAGVGRDFARFVAHRDGRSFVDLAATVEVAAPGQTVREHARALDDAVAAALDALVPAGSRTAVIHVGHHLAAPAVEKLVAIADFVLVLTGPRPDDAIARGLAVAGLRDGTDDAAWLGERVATLFAMPSAVARIAYVREAAQPIVALDERAAAWSGGPRTDAGIDRSFLARYVDLRDARLSFESDYLELLAEAQRRSIAASMRRLAPSFEQPLDPSVVLRANAILSEVAVTTRAWLSPPPGSRDRLEAILAMRLPRASVLRDLFRLDPFDGLAPFLDEAVMGSFLLPRQATLPYTCELQDAALRHRAFHRPQQTPYLFFHESVVGFLLNEVELEGRIWARDELDLHVARYPEFPSYFCRALAAYLDRDVRLVLGQHAGTHADGDAFFPPHVRDLFLAADVLYQHMELFMIAAKGSVGRRINADLHAFFAIPLLERFASRGACRLRADAGHRIDAAFAREIYGLEGERTRTPNEADVVRITSALAEEIWE